MKFALRYHREVTCSDTIKVIITRNFDKTNNKNGGWDHVTCLPLLQIVPNNIKKSNSNHFERSLDSLVRTPGLLRCNTDRIPRMNIRTNKNTGLVRVHGEQATLLFLGRGRSNSPGKLNLVQHEVHVSHAKKAPFVCPRCSFELH
jgi:hypothetical protein